MGSHLDQIENWPELAQQANWSVAMLAKSTGVSIRMLERYFLGSVGKPPKQWLHEQRQKLAMELLRRDYSVKETAIALGYLYPQHFSRDFKAHWGFSPSAEKTSFIPRASSLSHFGRQMSPFGK